MEITLPLHKMYVGLDAGNVVQYRLSDGNQQWEMNALIGKRITLRFEHTIYCVSCGRKTAKSFNQGFCYPCFKNAPEASPCIIHPELCEAHLNKGRDVEWEQKHHNQPHIVYLSQTSHVKVGITRDTQVPIRWIDQGAHAAIVLAQVPYRRLAGEIEVALKPYISDKTNWRAMLQNTFEPADLPAIKQQMIAHLPTHLHEYITGTAEIIRIAYPVKQYPEKVKSLSLDKTPAYTGILTGIKGQYLLFDDNTVFNVRKHSGYMTTILV